MGRPKGSKNVRCRVDDAGRECSTCLTYKPWDAFSSSVRGANGRTSKCRICASTKSKAERALRAAPKPYRDNDGKTCPGCRTYKPWAGFVKDTHSRDGYTSYCYPCRKALRDKWVAENPEKYNAGQVRWIGENKAYVLERARTAAKKLRDRLGPQAYCEKAKAYRRSDPERAAAYDRRQYARHGEKRRAFIRADRQANPVRYAVYDSRKRAKRGRAFCAWANYEAIAAIYAEAKRLTAETGIKHHVDHIVPLVNPRVQGLHVEHNLRVIPAEDNLKKSNRFIPELVEM